MMKKYLKLLRTCFFIALGLYLIAVITCALEKSIQTPDVVTRTVSVCILYPVIAFSTFFGVSYRVLLS